MTMSSVSSAAWRFRRSQKFEAGYIAGAKSVNPDVEVISLYVGNFEDTAKAKELGITAIEQGADIVFAAAGLPGAGVAQACVEKGALFIGVDADQYETLPEAQDVIITSAIKRVDQAVFLTTQAVVNGTFEGGITWSSVLPKMALVLLRTTTSRMSSRRRSRMRSTQAAQDVIDGTVEVPTDPCRLCRHLGTQRMSYAEGGWSQDGPVALTTLVRTRPVCGGSAMTHAAARTARNHEALSRCARER